MPPKDKKDPKTEETEVEEEELEQEDEQETEEQEETEEEEDLSPEELKARLAEREKALKKANAEAKERRLKLEALEKEKKEREEKDLSEAEKLKKDLSEKEEELERLRKEAQDLKLSQKFERAIRTQKIGFANEKAREDALRFLQDEDLGEDFEDLGDALKELIKDRPYLFRKLDPKDFIDDGSRKTTVNRRTVTRQAIDKKKRRVPPL